MHLTDEIVEKVPLRQWVFTLPKRFRIFVRFDRSLLGKLCSLAYETVREFLSNELGDETAVPGMCAVCQSWGDLLNWNTHVHAICSDGVFLPSGTFVPMKNTDTTAVVDIWKEKVFSLLLAEKKITPDVVESMRQWKHSGFSVHSSVCIEKDDTEALRRVAQYIGRSPMSLSRVVALTDDGSLIYRASHSHCLPFPLPADEELSAGSPRNFQIFSSFEFLAEFTAHIPDKYQHLVHYYGYYSNKNRGLRLTKDNAAQASPHSDHEPLSDYRTQCRITWAALIKCVFEANPLTCPHCGAEMRIVAFIDKSNADVVHKILKHCGLWNNPPPPRAPPTTVSSACGDAFAELTYDDSFFSQLVN
jgi:hypothetical protein